MRDTIEMWSETRMVVLTAITAAVYAATVMPLKIAPVIPGFTEIRPGVGLVIVCSLLFGPAAAWGAAFGNLISDFFGTLGLGSIPGFIGNFLFGYFPYKIYRSLTSQPVNLKSIISFRSLIIAIIVSAVVCAFSIGWGVDMLGLVPIKILGGIIALNNIILSLIIAPVMLSIVYPRARKWGVLYNDVLPVTLLHPGKYSTTGLILTVIGSVGGLIVALVSGTAMCPIDLSTPLNLSPFIIFIIAGAVLI